MLTWKEKRFKRIGKRFARRYSLIYWGHILWIASHIVGASYRDWSSVDKDISRSFATKRKLPQKGAGVRNQLQVIWFVGLQSRILCAFHHFYSCFYRPLLNACVILVKHTSRLQFRCVHTFQKSQMCAIFPRRVLPHPFDLRKNLVLESKSTLQVAVRWISSWDVDFTDSDIWTLLRFAWRTGWGGANLLLFQFFTPTQSDSWPVFLFVFVLVCVWGCMNICVCI